MPLRQLVQKLLLISLPLFALSACAAVSGKNNEVWLTLMGYNYTDHYIDNYYVDGVWGGNVFLSTEEAGGGKSTCCVKWKKGTKLPVTVRVRWQSDACRYIKRCPGRWPHLRYGDCAGAGRWEWATTCASLAGC